MAVVLGLVGGVGSIIIGGLKEEIADLKQRADGIDLRMTPLLTLNAQVTADRDALSVLRTDIDKKMDGNVFTLFTTNLNERIGTVEKNATTIVPRSENETHWAQVGALELRVNDLAKNAASCQK